MSSSQPSPRPPHQAVVRLFAALAEAAGAERVHVPLPPGATASALLERLAWFRPEIARYLAGCRIARNNQFLGPADPVSAGEDLAVIPPTSGG